MPLVLPPTPSLEQLKNQAKDLLRACRAQNPDALCRIQEVLTSSAGEPAHPFTHARALHVVAREYGFESWTKLKQHVQILSDDAERRAYLQKQVERLGVPRGDWRTLLSAAQELDRAGQAGLEAVIEGLAHPSSLVRRECAGFLDRHGTDACVGRLMFVALHDPVPNVRRTAVHSLTCQRCKPCPLTGDLAGFLAQVALSDANKKVRLEAVYGLAWLPPDARAIAALERILRDESDDALRKGAHQALKRQDPSYRKAVDERVRDQSIARAKASNPA